MTSTPPFRDAPVVIDRTYVQQRLIPTRDGAAGGAWPTTDGDSFTLWSSTQIPHVLRVMLALATGIPEHKIRVIAPDVGGGFGSKLQVTAEEVLCLLLARKLGKPVKWTESRSEGNLTVHHGRDQIQHIRLAAEADGRIRGLQVDLLADMGAYLMLVTPGIPLLGASMFNAIYKMDAYEFGCTGVFTTKMPTDAYRGAGRPEATFGIERIMDELAAELNVDPMEVRRRNWIRHEEFPYTTISGLTYDSGNYEAATEKALSLFGYDKLRAEQSDRRDRGDPVQLGIGVSTYTEMCGLAPSELLGAARLRRGRLGARLGADAAHRQGRGHHRHLAARPGTCDGVEPDRRRRARRAVRGRHGGARRHRDLAQGHGHLRLALAGRRRRRGAQGVREGQGEGPQAGRARAGVLARRPGLRRGRVHGARAPTRGRTIQELALAAFTAHDLPDGVEPALDSDATFDPDNYSFPHGTHLCAVEVDTETGLVKIRSYVAVDDVGKVVNPMIVEGQVHGGIAQGIAQALFEEAVYDAEGNLLTTHDRRLPAAVGGRPARLHHRPDRDPGHEQPAGRQGRRRGRHDRLHAGRGQRHRGRAAPVRRRTTSRCRARPSGSGGQLEGARP